MNKISWQKIPMAALGGLAACALMTAAYVFFMVMPILGRQQEAMLHRTELIAGKNKAAILALQVNQSQNDLTDIRRVVASNPLVLQSGDHLNNRLADITEFFKTCGLEVQDLSPGAVTVGDRYDNVSIRLTGRGNYRACLLFMHRLHEQFLDVAVVSFRLSGQTDDYTAPLLAQFELRWYARPGGVAASE